MIEFVTFKWKGPEGYRSSFGPEQVHVLRDMIRRNYSGDHRLTCITDDGSGIDPDVRVVDLSEFDERGLGKYPSPHGGMNPSCYRRLRLWSDDAKALIGDRICSIDLDVVITGDISPIVDRKEDFVLWGDYVNRRTHYNGSMQLIRAGCRPDVYSEFNPVKSPRLTRQAGFHGSDQAWLSLKFGASAPKWTIRDGVGSFRVHCHKYLGRALPNGLKVVFFHGQHDPWDEHIQNQYSWVREHWRLGN